MDAQSDTPCMTALNNMMRLTLFVQSTRMEELRVVGVNDVAFTALSQMHGAMEQVIQTVGAGMRSEG